MWGGSGPWGVVPKLDRPGYARVTPYTCGVAGWGVRLTRPKAKNETKVKYVTRGRLHVQQEISPLHSTSPSILG